MKFCETYIIRRHNKIPAPLHFDSDYTSIPYTFYQTRTPLKLLPSQLHKSTFQTTKNQRRCLHRRLNSQNHLIDFRFLPPDEQPQRASAGTFDTAASSLQRVTYIRAYNETRVLPASEKRHDEVSLYIQHMRASP